jgi:hypothetical protein
MSGRELQASQGHDLEVTERGDGVVDDPRDWYQPGLSGFSEGVLRAISEALFADEDEGGELVPAPEPMVDRSLSWMTRSLGRCTPQLRFAFSLLVVAIELLPVFFVGKLARASRLSLADRVHYLERLENSDNGWLAMLFVAMKVPLAIPAFEEGDELRLTGFDRATTSTRRALPMAGDAPANAARAKTTEVRA